MFLCSVCLSTSHFPLIKSHSKLIKHCIPIHILLLWKLLHFMFRNLFWSLQLSTLPTGMSVSDPDDRSAFPHQRLPLHERPLMVMKADRIRDGRGQWADRYMSTTLRCFALIPFSLEQMLRFFEFFVCLLDTIDLFMHITCNHIVDTMLYNILHTYMHLVVAKHISSFSYCRCSNT